MTLRVGSHGPLMDLLPGRKVTFQEPVVELNSEGNVEDNTWQNPLFLMWRCGWSGKPEQLGTPAWWPELKAILGVKDSRKLARKILGLFLYPCG